MAVRARRKRTSTLAANLETDARFMRGEPFKREGEGLRLLQTGLYKVIFTGSEGYGTILLEFRIDSF